MTADQLKDDSKYSDVNSVSQRLFEDVLFSEKPSERPSPAASNDARDSMLSGFYIAQLPGKDVPRAPEPVVSWEQLHNKSGNTSLSQRLGPVLTAWDSRREIAGAPKATINPENIGPMIMDAFKELKAISRTDKEVFKTTFEDISKHGQLYPLALAWTVDQMKLLNKSTLTQDDIAKLAMNALPESIDGKMTKFLLADAQHAGKSIPDGRGGNRKNLYFASDAQEKVYHQIVTDADTKTLSLEHLTQVLKGTDRRAK